MVTACAVTGFPARSRLRPHGGPAPCRRYERRRPEKTPLRRAVSESLESWLQLRDRSERPGHGLRHRICRGVLMQESQRLPFLQRSPHGTDRGASCRSRHPAGASDHPCRPGRAHRAGAAAAAADDILAWEHSGFSANWVGPSRGRKSTRPGANGVVVLTPFEFLARLTDLVPPPRKHRHRYHRMFTPNHRLRKNPRSHDTSRIAWAKLLARVGEEFPLECPICAPTAAVTSG
jgi:hypothetical protein